MKTQLKALKRYQNDLGNLRSHHWKYHIDLYENCYFDCKYCVYRSGDKMGKVTAFEDIFDYLREDLLNLREKGIVYVGPKADIYQPLEKKKQLMRKALPIFLETETPIFIITRSPLILRDIDLLSRMAEKGLVEVSITIASPNRLAELEPFTCSVEERINIAKELHDHGIPVSIHLSPIVPYLDDINELKALLELINRSTGSMCTYACMLGMREAYKSNVFNIVERMDRDKASQLMSIYGEEEIKDVQSADDAALKSIMEQLHDHAKVKGIPFACVHIPPLDTVEREGHIFKYKLPTIGDIYRHFSRKQLKEIRWEDMEHYLKSFAAVDEEFLEMVKNYWGEGVILKNTYYHTFRHEDGHVTYTLSDKIDYQIENMAVK
ncbi:SPL family radical SAM protein [Paenibacillus kobensis]|uniref:SPL family radical SAM protein n=1 Tax=Paenibacillus kobensis TaxID=59841 RepID=UPI0013E3F4CF|nr:radical SAM protein [Paenibacillus kobensis]